MLLPVALQLLQSDGKIDVKKSPLENAICLLESVLSCDLEEWTRATVVYTLYVMKMERTPAETPIILQLEQNPHGGTEVLDAAVLDWLVADYTQHTYLVTKKQKKRTLRSIAQGVKFTIKMRSLLSQGQESSDDLYISNNSLEDRSRIAKALEAT